MQRAVSIKCSGFNLIIIVIHSHSRHNVALCAAQRWNRNETGARKTIAAIALFYLKHWNVNSGKRGRKINEFKVSEQLFRALFIGRWTRAIWLILLSSVKDDDGDDWRFDDDSFFADSIWRISDQIWMHRPSFADSELDFQTTHHNWVAFSKGDVVLNFDKPSNSNPQCQNHHPHSPHLHFNQITIELDGLQANAFEITVVCCCFDEKKTTEYSLKSN